jgi:replication fork clamp-binding protein CrfC
LGAKITADGIDLCENPDLYGQIFPLSINNFGNVSNSNLAIGSPQANQTITQQEISPEIKQLLEELKQALANQDKKKAKSLFSKLLDFGGNIATQIITAAITYSSGLR